jgi:hypothetical protein
MSYKVRTLQRKRDHRASAVSLDRLWEMNHSSECVSGTPRRISERPDTGGLTVAAPVRLLHGRRIVRGFRRTACGSPSHGGLTPAAPVAYPDSASQIAHFAGNARRAIKSGWRKPAVVPETQLHSIHGTLQRTLHLPTHGGLTLASSHPAIFATSCKCDLQTHGGLTPPALV